MPASGRSRRPGERHKGRRCAPSRTRCRTARPVSHRSCPATGANARCSSARRRGGARSRPACHLPGTRGSGSVAGSRSPGSTWRPSESAGTSPASASAIRAARPGSSVDRPPSRADIERWTPYLRREIELVAPRLVLLVGGLAHRFAFGRAAKLDQLVGRELAWDGAPGAAVLCLPHPSGASTWLNDASHVELWRQATGLLRDRWSEIDR